MVDAPWEELRERDLQQQINEGESQSGAHPINPGEKEEGTTPKEEECP